MIEKIIYLNTDKAIQFFKIANTFKGNIDVYADSYVIDGKSIVGLFTLPFNKTLIARLTTNDLSEINRFNEIMENFKVNE